METHTENTSHLALVTVIVATNVTPLSALEIENMVAKRLEVLPTSCEYSGIVYSPWSSEGTVWECELLLGFSSDEEWEKWVLQMFGNQIDKPIDKLPAIVKAICTGDVGQDCGWASKLDETNDAARDAIQTPTKFFDSIDENWYKGVPQVRRFVLSCNNKFDKCYKLGWGRLCGKGLATTK
jgi:hypothetical protein